ncbi:MAG TPA: ABC transporter permease subunit [Conexibacter sp.]|jgi:NitT/TauT family transport system permease protein
MTTSAQTASPPSRALPGPATAQPRASASRRALSALLRSRLGVGTLAIVVAVGVWQLVGALDLISVEEIGSPSGAVSAGWELITTGQFFTAALVSLEGFALGMAISVLAGVPLGLAMGWNTVVRRSTEPVLTALYVTPYLALLPLLLVLFGIGRSLSVAVAVFAAVIPIVINVMAGIAAVDPVLIRVGRSLGASPLQLFSRVLVPAAVPSIAIGVRLGVGRAILGVIVAEMYVTVGGLGQLVTLYGSTYRIDYIVFLVLVIGLFGYLLSVLMAQLETRLSKWRSQ